MPHAVNPAFDLDLLSRIEDAGINASAPPQQRWVDGWLVRFSPGKAKRARCINAVAQGRLPVAAKLAACAVVFNDVQLPLFVRITPFSKPDDLDDRLASLGMPRIDDTRVMVCMSLDHISPLPLPDGHRIERLGHDPFAQLVGHLRGSPLAHRQAHAQRLAIAPVPFLGFVVKSRDGEAVACGQIAMESELVGLYDVFTASAHRGRGLAGALCAQMLVFARELGAAVAYLQVEADNAAARRVYHGMGFVDAYAYHYRGAPGKES
jgi:ribosomal protein S18 acetylase RimI-like enzyme